MKINKVLYVQQNWFYELTLLQLQSWPRFSSMNHVKTSMIKMLEKAEWQRESNQPQFDQCAQSRLPHALTQCCALSEQPQPRVSMATLFAVEHGKNTVSFTFRAHLQSHSLSGILHMNLTVYTGIQLTPNFRP